MWWRSESLSRRAVMGFAALNPSYEGSLALEVPYVWNGAQELKPPGPRVNDIPEL